jgi:hypothetical protein
MLCFNYSPYYEQSKYFIDSLYARIRFLPFFLSSVKKDIRLITCHLAIILRRVIVICVPACTRISCVSFPVLLCNESSASVACNEVR